MIDLNKEAREYVKNQLKGIVDKTSKFKCVNDFIAGANSKYVQAKIIQAQIDVLKKIRSKMSMFEISNMENTLDNLYYKEKEFKQQLKQLENETNN